MELVELMEMAQVKLANRKGRALTQQEGSGSESWGGDRDAPSGSRHPPGPNRREPLALWAAVRAPAEKMDDRTGSDPLISTKVLLSMKKRLFNWLWANCC